MLIYELFHFCQICCFIKIQEVHQKSIQALAELTAKGVEQFHKAGELVLLERDKDKDCTERAHSLARYISL